MHQLPKHKLAACFTVNHLSFHFVNAKDSRDESKSGPGYWDSATHGANFMINKSNKKTNEYVLNASICSVR